MRYYKVVVSNPTSGKVVRTFTSFDGSKNLPGALDVEFDILIAPFATPTGAGGVQIRGVSIADIEQATDLNGATIELYGGMQKGLPLANPAQAGLLTRGLAFQAFGNWIGTEQSLDLIIQPSTGAPDAPKNITHDWKKGTKLSDAVASTLSTAFPDLKQSVSISPKLVLTEDDPGFYQSLEQYAAYIKQLSQKIIGGSYPGVDMTITGTTISVYDGTTPPKPTQIAFVDMIGQPTWIDQLTVQTKMVMRADLVVGGIIQFPKNIQTTQTSAGATTVGSTLNQKVTFQGDFTITQIRHVGNFRQADAASWVTVVDAVGTAA